MSLFCLPLCACTENSEWDLEFPFLRSVVRNSLCMVPSALSDLTVRASGRVAKNSALGPPLAGGLVHYF